MSGARVSLGDVVTIQPGFAFDAASFGDKGELPLIRIRDVARGFSETFYTGEYDSAYLVKNGDLLISMDGEFRVGRWKGGKALLNQRVCRIVPKPEVMDGGYLFHFLPKKLKRIEDATSYATVKHLSGGKILGIKLVLPPIYEQGRIAAILDKADAVRRKRMESIRIGEKLLYSAFLELFGDPVSNSKDWEERRLAEISEIQSGVAKGKDLRGVKSISVPYMRVANVQDGKIVLDDVKEIEVLPSDVERLRLLPGDVLLTEGGDPDKLGRGAVWRGEIVPCIHQNHIFRVRPNPKTILPDYLSMLIGSARGKRYFLRAAKQTTGIATINRTQLESFPIPLPPIELQRKFEKFTQARTSIASQMNELGKTSECLFSAVVQSAFRGTT